MSKNLRARAKLNVNTLKAGMEGETVAVPNLTVVTEVPEEPVKAPAKKTAAKAEPVVQRASRPKGRVSEPAAPVVEETAVVEQATTAPDEAGEGAWRAFAVKPATTGTSRAHIRHNVPITAAMSERLAGLDALIVGEGGRYPVSRNHLIGAAIDLVAADPDRYDRPIAEPLSAVVSGRITEEQQTALAQVRFTPTGRRVVGVLLANAISDLLA